jgi:kynurenine formamidase
MVIDLSHYIEPGMPVYPGSQIPEIKDLDLHDELGVYVKSFSFDGHTGTHLDTPKHFFSKGESISSLDISTFTGKAEIIDCSQLIPGSYIPAQIIEDQKIIDNNDYIIIYTGWSDKWGTEGYFKGFPVLSQELAASLADSKIKGIGLDVISIDPVYSENTPNHKIVLGAGKIIVENLTNLERLIGKQFEFYCFPLKIKDGDASPVRAVAIIK